MNTYDVIIVGCGVAGCFAALHLPQNLNILMLSKKDLEESDSFLAQGGICVLKNADDYDSFYEDTLHAGHYENSPDAVATMIRSSQGVIRELLHYGVDFASDHGTLLFTREAAHSTNRILYHEDTTGKEITSKLLAAVMSRPNITILTHTAMVDILCRNQCCDGILAQTEQGELVPFFAQDVIWACGGIGGIYDNSTNYPHLTGDALAISLRHKIRLQNVSYVQIHPTTLFTHKKERRFLISESVRGEGAHLYDKNGQRFVNELLPRDLLTQEIHKQMKKDGTDYVWLSMLPIKELDVTTRFPNIYQHCLEEGYDITKQWIPVVPAQHYFMGGVAVDLNSHTSMKHLYASGETCCNGVHGANRLASNSLLESLVFAKNASLHILKTRKLLANAKKSRFAEYTKYSLQELSRIYELTPDEYQDTQALALEGKRQILEAMKAEQTLKLRKTAIGAANDLIEVR